MADINGVSSTSTGTLNFSSLSGATMGKEDFLKLLVAQLQNQDPLNPQDATEFTSQMAQFSSLEQLIGINEGVGGLSATSGEVEKLSALSLIGKGVVAESAGFQLGEAGTLNGQIGFHLDDAATKVDVTIVNESGRIVATMPPQAAPAGDNYLAWDGLGADGQPLPAGQYYLAVAADDGSGNSLTATPLVSGTITGVDFDSGGSLLYSAIGQFRMADVSSVREI